MFPARTSQALVVIALVLAPDTTPARAAQYYLAVDVPTTLGATTYTPNQIVRYNGGLYVLEGTFQENVTFAALARAPGGALLLSLASTYVESPEDQAIETRDVFLFDPATESGYLFLDGSAAGVPEYASIDALIYDPPTDAIAVSFDVPVRLGGVEYLPSDLVAYYGGAFYLVWSGAAAGVPPSVNVVGADMDSAGRLVVTFDVPVTLNGKTFLPGQLVRWEPEGGFSVHAVDPSWPLSSVLADFSFLPAAGEVPDGGSGSVPLTATSLAGGALTLSWGASCSSTDTDYAVYEGTLGAPFATHVPVTCSTGGATTWTFTPTPGNHYYLVVPRNAVSEGSYGHSSSLVPRPPSTAACLPQEVAEICL